jgi:hypothetical protein
VPSGRATASSMTNWPFMTRARMLIRQCYHPCPDGATTHLPDMILPEFFPPVVSAIGNTFRSWNLSPTQRSSTAASSLATMEPDPSAEFLHTRAHRLPAPTTPEQVRANAVEVSLRQLRELAQMTQAEVEASAGKCQGDVSLFERRRDALVSSLRRYVAAVGGDLTLVVTFGGEGEGPQTHTVRLG